MKIAVLGGGAWGSVLASLLSDAGYDMALWEADRAAAEALARDRRAARSLPGHVLPPAIRVTADLTEAVVGRALVVVAIPSETVRAALASARAALEPSAVVVCAA